VEMPDLRQDNEEQDSAEDCSEGMPDLIDHHNDSSEEDTVEFSLDSSEVTCQNIVRLAITWRLISEG